MSMPDRAVPDVEDDDTGGGLSAGQIAWMNEDGEGREMVERVLDELFGEDE